MAAPKLFISYSWSDPAHEEWVLNLATELRESGVDAILDKWDLKDGHDAVAFMEKMVTDPEINKVLIISDKTYAKKADGRAGGVGTETQIISKEVYDNQEQDKFVAVVTQKDESGNPYLPTYYKTRLHIDFSEVDSYGDSFEKLLRWIFDKPLYIKPEMGNKPLFLDEDQAISLGTTASFKRAIESIKNDKPYASGALDEYLSEFSENFERFRIKPGNEEFDDQIVKNIESFIPFRNQIIQLLIIINQFSPTEENVKKLHRFFEKLIPYMERPEHLTRWKKWDFDNFKFIVHELFLYAIAIFIKFENYRQVSQLFEQRYYLPSRSDYGRNAMVDFTRFRQYMQSLEYRNERLGLRKLSIRADLLKDRCVGIGIEFRHLMQADFVIFMRTEIAPPDNSTRWWPETLIWINSDYSTLEIFARATSKKYFDRIKVLLAIEKPSDLVDLLQSYKDYSRKLPRWEFRSFNPSELLGYEKLATEP